MMMMMMIIIIIIIIIIVVVVVVVAFVVIINISSILVIITHLGTDCVGYSLVCSCLLLLGNGTCPFNCTFKSISQLPKDKHTSAQSM